MKIGAKLDKVRHKIKISLRHALARFELLVGLHVLCRILGRCLKMAYREKQFIADNSSMKSF